MRVTNIKMVQLANGQFEQKQKTHQTIEIETYKQTNKNKKAQALKHTLAHLCFRSASQPSCFHQVSHRILTRCCWSLELPLSIRDRKWPSLRHRACYLAGVEKSIQLPICPGLWLVDLLCSHWLKSKSKKDSGWHRRSDFGFFLAPSA